MYGDQSMLDKLKGYIFKDKTLENRTKALLCFLPKWRGFLVNEAAEKMNATKALVKLLNVVNCLSKVWIKESKFNYPQQKQPINFDVRKVNCS